MRGAKKKHYAARLSLNYTAVVRNELVAVAERYGLPFAQVVRESLAAGVNQIRFGAAAVAGPPGEQDGGGEMKTIQCLSILIVLVVIAGGCKGEPGPVGPVPLARESNVSIHPSSPADSLVVSFEGTRIRITNTSGGNRIAANKLIVFHADWNIHAWDVSDSVPVSEDITTQAWDDYIGDHIRIRLHCRDSDEYMQMGIGFENPIRWNLFALEAPDKVIAAGTSHPNSAPKSLRDCEAPFLSIVDVPRRFWTRAPGSGRDAPVDFERNTGGKWKIEDGTIALNDVEFFTAPRLSITYHPVVSDSSQIERETLWVQTIVDDRQGFVEHIDRALPVDAVDVGLARYPPRPAVFKVGEAVYAPGASRSGLTGLFAALEALSVLLQDVGPTGSGDAVVTIHIGMSRLGGGGGAAGGNVGGGWPGWAVFGYSDPANAIHRGSFYESSTLIHELGHTLGLRHTPTFHNPDILYPARDYPLPSGLIDRDGYLVRDIVNQEIHVWDAGFTYDFMSYEGATWVSNHNWNKMVDRLENFTPPSVSARVIAGGDQMWICNGQH